MGAMTGWILSTKTILISAGLLSLAVALKLFIPMAVNGAPALWSIVLSWMKPPYLYLIINGIIIIIAASSRFHHSHTESAAAVRSDQLFSVKTPTNAAFESFLAPPVVIPAVIEPPVAAEVVMPEVKDSVVDLKFVMLSGSEVDFTTEATEDLPRAESEDVLGESSFPYNPPQNKTILPEVQLESLFPARQKPLASSRFVHRKPNRIPPEAGARGLRRVARPKKQETLESTWKMITEGRHVPLTRHLKKSDTWEHHAPPAMDRVLPPKSAETFKDRAHYDSPAPAVARIRKEPSVGQDELNRRVEAFINKFNEDMRMQRQESLNQYMEMINRGL